MIEFVRDEDNTIIRSAIIDGYFSFYMKNEDIEHAFFIDSNNEVSVWFWDI